MKQEYNLVIIGGGPAGLAAAVSAYDNGERDILVIEREERSGGILNQCIHNGFGLHRFKQTLTGPEYAGRYRELAKDRDIAVMTETTVLSVSPDKVVTAMNREQGVFTVRAKAVILAMGCRERSRGALGIAGSRPAGIYSAGTAQKYVNIMGYLPGKNVVILGSGDIGLIMARRMTLEGAKVHAVCEIMPYSSGLKRNIVQCLDDFGIPLYLNHTIIEIKGEGRVTGVTIAQVDQNKQPIKGTEKYFDCDTVLFSVGLIPENELTEGANVAMSPNTRGAIVYQNRETLTDGIFACGNVLHVHDLVDFVSEEAEIAGKSAVEYIKNGSCERKAIDVERGDKVGYVIPQKIDKNIKGDVKFFFRVTGEYKNAKVVIKDGDTVIKEIKKLVVTPGEMQTVILKENEILGLDQKLVIGVEV
ncbi:MAG: FAD-dependent oxidoreductase [Clostridia bacterium]|nr:FAD-dependent oxidoreductase [Clostridia bacterium]